jgi:phage-related baseplate assembly protein
MSLAKKLNLKDGMQLRVIGRPEGVSLDDVDTTPSPLADGVLAFVRTLAEVDATCGPVLEAARADRLAWVAYPKAGQLGTDLNRDKLWAHLQARGVDGVRQVAIDEVWSAMRFRPGA